MDKIMKEKTKKKRQLILDAALSVFLQNGYEKTKIIDIAQKAGIGKGTVYEYFDSKEALFHCLLDTYCQYYKKAIQESLTGTEGQSSRKKLLAIMCAERRFQEAVGVESMSPLQLQMEFSHFPGLNQAFFAMMKFKFDVLCRILSDGVAAGELRHINVPFTSIILMSACGVTFTLAENRLSEPCALSERSPRYWIPADERKSFTDEAFLDLIMYGLCAPA